MEEAHSVFTVGFIVTVVVLSLHIDYIKKILRPQFCSIVIVVLFSIVHIFHAVPPMTVYNCQHGYFPLFLFSSAKAPHPLSHEVRVPCKKSAGKPVRI